MCGRVNAFQHGSPNAFLPTINTGNGLEDIYVDGVSLTHGPAGSCQHIWTFVAAWFEGDTLLSSKCSCTGESWPFEVPGFVGDDYFCDTANRGPDLQQGVYFPDDPLWDGEGCGPISTCCEFNNPPWFCTTLPQPTADDIEARLCMSESINNENVIISLLDIYVM